MRALSSLRSRIFLASALLAVLCIVVAIYLVNVRVTEEAERTLQREIVAAAALVDNLRTTRTETFTQMARFIADAPPLKAAVDTNDPTTVQEIANRYQDQVKSNLLIVTNKAGSVLATVGASGRSAAVISNKQAIHNGLAGRETLSLLPQPDGIIQLVTVPVYIGLIPPDILGTLSVGFMLDNALASQLKQISLSDIAFGMHGEILAATLPREHYPALAGRLDSVGISRVQLGDEVYEALPLPLAPIGGAAKAASGPVALILRSRTAQLLSLQSIHKGLMVTAVVAVLLATVLGFAVARTIAQPLAAITGVMREVAATGDLTRKIAPRHGNRWDDDDARLLATTFNTLTDSIARFQREMSQKERLTALGRLSTVIAHEVRNPLMIIKAALHSLRQPGVAPAVAGEAIADIDEEVVRLNRIVNEVLDFARPIRFELSRVDVNAICRESAGAALAAAPGAAVALDLDSGLAMMTTDPGRLRIALVNLLVNARHAVNGNGGIVSLTSRANADSVRITVADNGPGIAGGDLARVFDPYFTTKRAGTGLGLPIAKNIVEGLGGTLGVASPPGQGTDFIIDLPFEAPPAVGGSKADQLPQGGPARS
jgi:signal transduction histidine kinase